VIGFSFIALSRLLTAPESASKLRFIDKYYAIHSLRDQLPIRGVESYGDLQSMALRAVGNVRVCCSLERFEIATEAVVEADGARRARDSANEAAVGGGGADAVEPRHFEAGGDGVARCDASETASALKNGHFVQKELIGELKRWKAEQHRKWQDRWKALEVERLNALELEFRKNEELRAQQLRRKKLEIVKLEKKLKCSLYDIECQEKKVKAEQSRLEDRRRGLEQSYKLKTAELVHSLKRARADSRMEIETLNRTIHFLQNENELIATKYRNEEKRANDRRKELHQQKRLFDASSMGQLQLENEKLKAKVADLDDRARSKESEIQRANDRADAAERRIKALQKEMVEHEKKQIDREKKEMERLRLELMAKSHFKALRNDRTELQQIKSSLSKIMNSAAQ